MVLVCSICGKKFESNMNADAQKHLTSHTGIFAEMKSVDTSRQHSMKYD